MKMLVGPFGNKKNVGWSKLTTDQHLSAIV